MKIKVTSEQGGVKEYIVTINYRQASNNTAIKSIAFDKGQMEPAFDPNIKNYTITVPRDTYDINITDLVTEEQIHFIENTTNGSYTEGIMLNNLDTM